MLPDHRTPRMHRCCRHLADSLMLATALAPHIGYDRAAEIAARAHRDRTTLREAALASGGVSERQFDAWVRPEKMLSPGAAKGA